jgi:hypothetical protein
MARRRDPLGAGFVRYGDSWSPLADVRTEHQDAGIARSDTLAERDRCRIRPRFVRFDVSQTRAGGGERQAAGRPPQASSARFGLSQRSASATSIPFRRA